MRHLRERLDKLPALELQGAFTALMRQAQRGKALEPFNETVSQGKETGTINVFVTLQ